MQAPNQALVLIASHSERLQPEPEARLKARNRLNRKVKIEYSGGLDVFFFCKTSRGWYGRAFPLHHPASLATCWGVRQNGRLSSHGSQCRRSGIRRDLCGPQGLVWQQALGCGRSHVTPTSGAEQHELLLGSGELKPGTPPPLGMGKTCNSSGTSMAISLVVLKTRGPKHQG